MFFSLILQTSIYFVWKVQLISVFCFEVMIFENLCSHK